MKTFVRSSSCISPQKTFAAEGFLSDVVEYTGTRLRAIAPDYKEFVDPKFIRRMSHIIKMGVSAGRDCLSSANVVMPGAVITGTALGCLEDTVTFLTRMVEQNEELLPPTAFIQSTHNTVAAQIALTLQCHGYNNTFVHKGISFESALLDAIMLLKEQQTDDILVGAAEELVDASFTVLTRLGLYKRWPVSNLEVLSTPSNGTIGGEGAAFFLLTGKASPDNLAEIPAIKTLYRPGNIESSISSFLEEYAIKMEDIDLVIMGKNGDTRNDRVYQGLEDVLFKNKSIACYKHLCGEYATSSSFALWLAAGMIKKGVVPQVVIRKNINLTVPKTVLIYNHYQNKYHSLILVSAAI
jgi:3-oxoacyl-[acyl-carrier-protein] synthase II